MILTKDRYLESIQERLALLQTNIKRQNGNLRYDINRAAEDFYAHFLNMVYGYSLSNDNYQVKNRAAIDLADEKNRIAVQVTSDSSSGKVKETLEKFKKNSYGGRAYSDVFDRLIILIITEKEPHERAYKSMPDAGIEFDPEKDIWDVNDIIKRLASSDYSLDELKKVAAFLEENITFQANIYSSGNAPAPVRVISGEGEFLLEDNYEIFGRVSETAEIIAALETERIIIIHGEGGIGKTKLCREVLKRAGKKIVAVNLIECRTFREFVTRTAGCLGVAVSPDMNEGMIERAVRDALSSSGTELLYLDNFEDVISEKKTYDTTRKGVYDFLRKCSSSKGLSLLISSRELPARGLPFWNLLLDTLDEKSAVQLFKSQWRGRGTDEEIREFVARKLHCYPLSIVLCASQWDYAASVKKLSEMWDAAKVKVDNMDNKRHKSIETALLMTFEEVEDDKSARWLWELFTLFPDKIGEETAETIIEDYLDAMRKLVKLSVLRRGETQDGGSMLFMQPTLREYVERTSPFEKDAGELSERLVNYYTDLYDINRVKEQGSDRDRAAVRRLSDVLFFMDRLRSVKAAEEFSKLHKKLRDYYHEAPYEAADILATAIKELDFGEDFGTIASLNKYCGDLEMRTAKLAEAEGHYREAESLYRRIQDDLGLANVLQVQGDLEMRTAKLAEAEGHYREAERLYRRIQDDLGLANVLQAQGDLEMRTDKLSEAEGHYREAESLYRRIHADLGLANVLKAQGDLERRTAKLAEAEGHYREAESLYRRIHADLGLANVLQAQGDLEMRTAKLAEAEGHYREAESLYRRIHADLGLANVLKAQGDLKMRTDKLAEAEGHYREAERLYRRIQDDLGLANVLKAQGDLKMRTDKLAEAEGHYREAESLYRRIHADLGLANVLKAQGDLEMRTDKLSEAEGHYREAESLYRRIHADLGLANVLKAQGDLEMWTDKLAEAEGHYREAESLYRRIQDDLGLANLLQSAGDMLQKMEKYKEASEKYEAAILLYEKTQNILWLSISYAELCFCSAKLGDTDKARECLIRMTPILDSLPYDYVKSYCNDLAKEAREILGASI